MHWNTQSQSRNQQRKLRKNQYQQHSSCIIIFITTTIIMLNLKLNTVVRSNYSKILSSTIRTVEGFTVSTSTSTSKSKSISTASSSILHRLSCFGQYSTVKNNIDYVNADGSDSIVNNINDSRKLLSDEQQEQDQQPYLVSQSGMWNVYLDYTTNSKGLLYYYNTITGQSQWTRPLDFQSFPIVDSVSSSSLTSSSDTTTNNNNNSPIIQFPIPIQEQLLKKRLQQSDKLLVTLQLYQQQNQLKQQQLLIQQQQQQQQELQPTSNRTDDNSNSDNKSNLLVTSSLPGEVDNDTWILSQLQLQLQLQLPNIETVSSSSSLLIDTVSTPQQQRELNTKTLTSSINNILVDETIKLLNDIETTAPASTTTTTNPTSWLQSLWNDLSNQLQIQQQQQNDIVTIPQGEDQNNGTNNNTTDTINEKLLSLEVEEYNKIKLQYFQRIMNIANEKVLEQQQQLNISYTSTSRLDVSTTTTKMNSIVKDAIYENEIVAAVAAAEQAMSLLATSSTTTSSDIDTIVPISDTVTIVNGIVEPKSIIQPQPPKSNGISTTSINNDVAVSEVEQVDVFNSTTATILPIIQLKESSTNSDQTTTTISSNDESSGTDSSSSSISKNNKFTLLSSSIILPHPYKVSWGGEDAIFINNNTFGVFDGVSGAEKDATLPLYSRTVALQMSRLITEQQSQQQNLDNKIENNVNVNNDDNEQPILVLIDQLSEAAYIADETATGATTAIVGNICTETGLLNVLNLGDSSCIVIRNGNVIKKTDNIVHYFNCPYQLSVDSPDMPRDGTQLINFQLQSNDLLFIASDGIFDNLFDTDIALYLTNNVFKVTNDSSTTNNTNNNKKTTVTLLNNVTESIAQYARDVSLINVIPKKLSPTKKAIGPVTPFALESQLLGDPDFIDGVGGKCDDICCILIKVS